LQIWDLVAFGSMQLSIIRNALQVQLGEVVAGKGNTPLLVPNENDETPQCLLRDVIGSSTA